jgi:hypothetical protein
MACCFRSEPEHLNAVLEDQERQKRKIELVISAEFDPSRLDLFALLDGAREKLTLGRAWQLCLAGRFNFTDIGSCTHWKLDLGRLL